jgi:choline dehydrogenase-like flavoprotein
VCSTLNRDNYEAIIQVPAWVGQDIGGQYDWNLLTVNQTQLDGKQRSLPQGKVLGGGSILNAMVWNRGGKDDYDIWASFGNQGWDWAGMLPYFKKVCDLHSRKSSLLLITFIERNLHTGLL